MKNKLQILASLLLIGTLLIGLAACGGKTAVEPSAETTSASEETNTVSAEPEQPGGSDVFNDSTESEYASDESAAPVSEADSQKEETATNEVGAKVSTTKKPGSNGKDKKDKDDPTTSTTKKETPTEKKIKSIPPEKVLAYYKNAINKAANGGAGYVYKYHNELLNNPNFGSDKYGQKVKGFLQLDEDVDKDLRSERGIHETSLGTYCGLMKCTLEEKDVTSKSCTVSGDDYIITLKIRNGSSDKKTNDSPIENTGLCHADLNDLKDLDVYAHKNAQVIIYAGKPFVTDVTESSKDGIVKITINSKTQQIKEIKISFTCSATISYVNPENWLKGKFTPQTANALMSTVATYSNFVY